MFILEFKNHAYVFLNGYTGKIIDRINSLCRHSRLAQYDFFKDPIHFCITPLSVYITNINPVLEFM